MRIINVNNTKKGTGVDKGNSDLLTNEKITVKIINKLNRAVVHMCRGNLNLARQDFD